MTDQGRYDREASETLALLGRSRGAAPAHFVEEVMRRLPPGGVPRRGKVARGAGLALAGLALLAALDAAAILGAHTRTAVASRDTAVDSLAAEYDMTARSLRTWE